MAAGFLGVLLVVQPGAGTFQVAALLPVASTFLISFRDFMTNRIAAHVPTLIVTLVTACFGMLVGLVGSGFESWQPLGLAAYAILLGGALTLIGGHMLVIAAFRAGDPAVVSPFRYAGVPFAVAYGALHLRHAPGRHRARRHGADHRRRGLHGAQPAPRGRSRRSRCWSRRSRSSCFSILRGRLRRHLRMRFI